MRSPAVQWAERLLHRTDEGTLTTVGGVFDLEGYPCTARVPVAMVGARPWVLVARRSALAEHLLTSARVSLLLGRLGRSEGRSLTLVGDLCQQPTDRAAGYFGRACVGAGAATCWALEIAAARWDRAGGAGSWMDLGALRRRLAANDLVAAEG